MAAKRALMTFIYTDEFADLLDERRSVALMAWKVMIPTQLATTPSMQQR